MTRDEIVELRNTLLLERDRLKIIGDFDASAATIRLAIESLLKLTDHALEKARK